MAFCVRAVSRSHFMSSCLFVSRILLEVPSEKAACAPELLSAGLSASWEFSPAPTSAPGAVGGWRPPEACLGCAPS